MIVVISGFIILEVCGVTEYWRYLLLIVSVAVEVISNNLNIGDLGKSLRSRHVLEHFFGVLFIIEKSNI